MSGRLSSNPLAHPAPLIRRVHAYAAYRLGDGPDAEDVTSEVFERALRGIKTFDGTKGDAIGWLLGIARRVVAEEFARRARAPQGELPLVAARDNLEQSALTRLDLVAAVRRLNPRDAELIALRYGADLRVSEVARILGLRKNTVDVALHRARLRLAEIMTEGDEETAADTAVSFAGGSPY
jgi:RNA polymerase sigma factor (sigma-70 family)